MITKQMLLNKISVSREVFGERRQFHPQANSYRLWDRLSLTAKKK